MFLVWVGGWVGGWVGWGRRGRTSFVLRQCPNHWYLQRCASSHFAQHAAQGCGARQIGTNIRALGDHAEITGIYGVLLPLCATYGAGMWNKTRRHKHPCLWRPCRKHRYSLVFIVINTIIMIIIIVVFIAAAVFDSLCNILCKGCGTRLRCHKRGRPLQCPTLCCEEWAFPGFLAT